MEKTYWLGRKRAAAAMARNAAGAEARLVHLDLAGRYSVKAAACADGAIGGRAAAAQAKPASPAADNLPYAELEQGARYLAAGAASEAERHRHLGMANRYARFAADDAGRGER